MSKLLQEKLASDAYKRHFLDDQPLSSLQPLYAELADDLHCSPQLIRQLLQQRLSGDSVSYAQAKQVIGQQFLPGTDREDVTPAHKEMLAVQEAVQLFQQTHSDADTAAFQSLLRDKLLSGGKKSPAPALTWTMYKECVQKWESHKNKTDPVVEKLRKTIADYKEALANLDPGSPQQTAIRDLIVTLEGQMKGLSVPADPTVLQKLQRRQFKSLQGIFSFYCKQQLNSGIGGTFDGISESNSHWNLGKFVKFAVDFQLTGRPSKTERLLSKEELKLVFIACADMRKLMDFAHFLTALSQIADRRYDAQYDAIHATSVQMKSLADKQALLYIDLHLEDVETLRRTMKSFAIAFTREEDGFRLPADDLAKRYQPISPEQREALKDWRKRKAIFSTDSASISSLKSSGESLHQTMVKIPSDAVALKRAPPESYSDIYHLRHHPVSLTWQTLSSMQYTDINVTQDIVEVIGMTNSDSDSDLLDKQYHFGKFYNPDGWKTYSISGVPKKSASERRYDGLMRLVEEKVNRGMHSLARMSTTMSAVNQTSLAT